MGVSKANLTEKKPDVFTLQFFTFSPKARIPEELIIDLSKAFDSLQHDMLIAKLHVYGFEMKTPKLIFSYLINRTQTVKVNGEYTVHSLTFGRVLLQ